MKKNPIFTVLFAMFSLLTLNVNAQTPTFQEFLQQFPKASLPYSFNAQELQGTLESNAAPKVKRLSWDFYQFLPELERSAQFSNMPVYPEPVAAFETEKYHAVLYNIARGLSRGTKTYSITVFDKKGNYIGTHFVAGVNAQTLTIATIDAQLNANVKAFKVNWENETTANGQEAKKVSGLMLQDMQTLELTTAGNPDEIEWASRRELNQTSSLTADVAKSK